MMTRSDTQTEIQSMIAPGQICRDRTRDTFIINGLVRWQVGYMGVLTEAHDVGAVRP